jgi:60 kDa SS-A/Ro ribonucleoprotein
MPQTALMRQLPRLTRLGVLDGAVGVTVAEQLADAGRLARARVHPVNVLVAQRTYASGRGARGNAQWTPIRRISDALDAAFYAAYGAVRPANKRSLLALDVSGSMGQGVGGLPVTCREAAAALAMVTAATEPQHRVVGFTAGGRRFNDTAITEPDIGPRRRLDDVCRYTAGLQFGATDCALPMIWARQNRVEVDTFHIYTDNETWYGSIHPHQALQQYRQHMGIDARLVVVSMTATRNSIADPADPRQLDISGFDSTVPTLLADFSRGDI